MSTRKNSHGNPERRKKEAKERQETYSLLTTKQKLEKLPVNGSIKQREKLSK